jgi:hypothetical protein
MIVIGLLIVGAVGVLLREHTLGLFIFISIMMIYNSIAGLILRAIGLDFGEYDLSAGRTIVFMALWLLAGIFGRLFGEDHKIIVGISFILVGVVGICLFQSFNAFTGNLVASFYFNFPIWFGLPIGDIGVVSVLGIVLGIAFMTPLGED